MDQQLRVKSQAPTIRLCLSVCLGTFVSAYVSVCLSQLGTFYREKNKLLLEEFVWQVTIATSSFNFGSILGPIFYAFVERYLQAALGIRRIFIAIDTCCLFVQIWILFELRFLNLVIGRVILGIFIGVSTSLVPRYVRIMSPLHIVGKMGTFNQLMQTFGVLFSCLLGFLVININDSDKIYWRIYLGFPIVVLVLRLLALAFIYPYDTNDVEWLQVYLRQIYEEKDLQIGARQIMLAGVKKQKEQETQVSKRTYKKRFFIGMALMASNQVTGINAIVLYLKQLTNKIVGIHKSSTLYSQIVMVLISATQVLATASATARIEKEGRKKMLLEGQLKIIIVLISIFLAGKLSFLIPEPVLEPVILLLILIHIVIHNRGLGSLCIIYCADILQDLNWMIVMIKICSFSVALASEYMIQYLGIGNMFLIFATLSSILHALLRLWIVQTKNLHRKQIYVLFDSQNGKRKTKNV